MTRLQRIELLLFVACFAAFAYFNQGGGWNQNARFAEVRAMVEQGRFAIDDFLVYRPDADKDDLVRIPVNEGEYVLGGKRYRLSWVDMDWNLYPVGEKPLGPGVEKAPMVELCASGDVSYVASTGHFHPNKPPGTSFLAVPGYFFIHTIEGWFGMDPDHWWTLNLNQWLTTVCSVGLLSALGCVIFFRIAREFCGGNDCAALAATVAFAFGTTFLPFGTIFFDHNATAALLLGSFYLIRESLRPHPGNASSGTWQQVLAGFMGGLAAITNYVAAVIVAFLAVYLLLASPDRKRHWRAVMLFLAGNIPPFLLICFYGWVCFGSPFRLNTDFQNPLFKDPNGVLGMFALPNGYVASLLLFSPFRGVLYLAPVLILGVVGIFWLLKERRFVPECRLILAVFGFFFLVNASFNGYHAGYSAGPRYLIPGIPFLALPLVIGFVRWPYIASVLAAVSIIINGLLTVTDAQNPVGVGGHARVEDGRPEWGYNLVSQYAWPLFAYYRAWPLLNDQQKLHMRTEVARIESEGGSSEEKEAKKAALRLELRESIERGDVSPFLLASLSGPVSVNPVGVYEGLFTYGSFPPDSPQSRYASFNAGELIPGLAGTRSSLLPLGLVLAVFLGAAFWMARSKPDSPVAVDAAPKLPELPPEPALKQES